MSATTNEPELQQESNSTGQEETTLAENVEQTMDTSTEAANQELELLQAIPELMEKAAQEPWQYETHVQLIQALRQVDMKDDLHEARLRMHQIYPLTEAMWLEWIQDAMLQGQSPEQIKNLHLLAAQDYLSIPIWKSYVDFVITNYKSQAGISDDDVDDVQIKKLTDDELQELTEETRKELLAACHATNYHIAESHRIWNEYMDFELLLMKGASKPETIQNIRALYLERLMCIHMAWDQTFERFSTFVSAHDNAQYEETMVAVNQQCAAIKEAVGDREIIESELVQKRYDLNVLQEYLLKEKRARTAPSLSQGLYERAVAVHCTDAGLWEDYALFQIEHEISEVDKVIRVAERAIRNCPWSGELRTLHAGIYEQYSAGEDEMESLFQQALSNGLLLASFDDLVKTLMAKCDYVRRRIDWSSDNLAEESKALRQTFKDAHSLIAKAFPKTNDPYYRLEEYEASVEVRLGEPKKARLIWEKIIKQHINEVDAWQKFLNIEKASGNISYCEQLFRRAINKELDYPDRLMDTWIRMEHEYGTVESMREARILIKRRTYQLNLQWQQLQEAQQYAPQETVVASDGATAPVAAEASVSEPTPEELKAQEQKRKERVQRIRKKSKQREKKHRERQQQERAEQQEAPAEQTDKPVEESHKRRRSVDDTQEQEPKQAKVDVEQQEEKRKELRAKPITTLVPAAIRRRGGARPTPTRRLAVPKKSNPVSQPASTEQHNQKESQDASGAKDTKSNDDFRAMFLKK
ncbi:Squamous cell carcinoma antigen recognized by T-cells 3 [Umbelopsis sp. WA50703]